jgi:hypothetical protein
MLLVLNYLFILTNKWKSNGRQITCTTKKANGYKDAHWYADERFVTQR